MRAEFPEKKYKNIEFADLREFMEIKLKQMLTANKTRGKFLERFQQVIDEYNSGSVSIEKAYEDLISEAENLSKEEQRAAREGMSEEELEIFDLLKKEKLSQKEKKLVKKAAHSLLKIVREARSEVFIPEWHKEKASQETVRRAIQRVLNDHLPKSYDREIFSRKTELIFQHFYELAATGRMAG